MPFARARDGSPHVFGKNLFAPPSTTPGLQSPGNPTGPLHAVHQRAAPDISLPREGRAGQPVLRGRVHQCTDARRPPKPSDFVRNRPTRKMPLRPPTALRISFRLRDIRSGPRLFGDSKSVIGQVPANASENRADVHYLPRGNSRAPCDSGRLLPVLAELTPFQQLVSGGRPTTVNRSKHRSPNRPLYRIPLAVR